MNKIIISFFTFFLISFSHSSYAFQKVEDVFVDIDKNYVYYHELQSLYDKEMIHPDLESKFNPNKLLTRDEFVWVVMEVGCTQCAKPNTAWEYILKYWEKKPFFDVDNKNDHFYCISEAYEKEVVKWYDIGHICEDTTTSSGEIPFCTNNNITLEEAVAFLLRNSSVFTVRDNQNILSQIANGTLTEKLSNDVWVKNIDGSVYTFYGYFKKALELDYKEYDLYGNEKRYDFIEIDGNGNINPKKYITKQDFLKMAYIVSKLNSCSINNTNTSSSQIGLQIQVLDKICTQADRNCKKSDLQDNTWTYDWKADFVSKCSQGIKNTTWIFYNSDTKETFLKTGLYLDNYQFPSKWNWLVRVIVEDNCGNISESQVRVNYNGNNSLSLEIWANPLSWTGKLKVTFQAITNCQNCTYIWNFWDGTTSSAKNPTHIFQEKWNYPVELIIRDGNGKPASSKISIFVDGIFNNDDFAKKLEDLEKELWFNDILEELKQISDSEDISEKLKELEKEIWPNTTFEQLKDMLWNETLDLSKIDTDGDGVPDSDDKCLNIPWDKNNFWCPILDQTCLPNSEIDTCKSWFFCNAKWFCEVKKESVLSGTCLYPQSGSSIFWNVMCNSCPCDYSLQFLASLRKCDVIIPAIVSPDGKDIYGKGITYEIPYDYK